MSDTFLAAMAARSADMACTFPVGTRVLIHSLSGRPELNGRLGCVVRGLQAATGRYGVLIDGFSLLVDGFSPLKSVALKATNIDVTTQELCPQLESEENREVRVLFGRNLTQPRLLRLQYPTYPPCRR